MCASVSDRVSLCHSLTCICVRFLKSEVYKDCIRAEMAGCSDQTGLPGGLSGEAGDIQTAR